MDGLNIKLLDRVFNMENVPTTLEGWYTAAAKYDGQWRRANAIIGKANGSAKSEKASTPYSPPTLDPNVMDIDHLTPAEQTEHMKHGKCFVCHQTGHRAADHKKGNTTPPRNRMGQFVPQKKTGVEAYKRIAALLGDLKDRKTWLFPK
jgi:hypothetical protein